MPTYRDYRYEIVGAATPDTWAWRVCRGSNPDLVSSGAVSGSYLKAMHLTQKAIDHYLRGKVINNPLGAGHRGASRLAPALRLQQRVIGDSRCPGML